MKTKSRWATWSSGTEIKKGFHNIFLEASGNPDAAGYSPSNISPAETDTGNPTGTGAVTPSERARQMGLISNGHGGYTDPSTGEVVARTINGELVFYDSRATGGVVADGGGGMALTQSAPSWKDPDTGMIIVPPAAPESPEELAVVPDPTPAAPPWGYEKFMQQKKIETAQANKAQQAAEQEVEAKEMELEQTNPGIATSRNKYMEERDRIEMLTTQAIESGDEKRASNGTKQLAFMDQAISTFDENLEEFKAKFGHMADDFQSELAYLHLKSYDAKARVAPINEKIEETLDKRDNGEIDEAEAEIILNNLRQARRKRVAGVKGRDPDRKEELEKIADQEREAKLTTIEGDKTSYLLRYMDPYSSHYTDRVDEFSKVFKDQIKNYGIDPDLIGDIATISWDTNKDPEEFTDDEDENDQINRKLTAFDALKTWRRKVLPSLKPGTILYNSPVEGGRQFDDGTEARERIYSLAGFGDLLNNEEISGQYGLVIQTEDGKNKLVPLNPDNKSKTKSETRKRKLKEDIIDYIIIGDLDINEQLEWMNKLLL